MPHSLQEVTLISEQPPNLLLRRRRYSTDHLICWLIKKGKLPLLGKLGLKEAHSLTHMISGLYNSTFFVGAGDFAVAPKLKLRLRDYGTLWLPLRRENATSVDGGGAAGAIPCHAYRAVPHTALLI